MREFTPTEYSWPHLKPDVLVSDHALEQWRSRVSPGASDAEAETAISNMLEKGSPLEPPERMVRTSRNGVPRRYITWDRYPDVILVVSGDGSEVISVVPVNPPAWSRSAT